MDIKVVTKVIENKAAQVDVSGEIDVYTSPKVKEAINALIEEGHYNLIINLEQVRYIDSTGLGILIGALKKVREHSGNIFLVCVDQQIKKVFTITGLVKIFKIFDNNEAAIAAFAS